MRGTVTKTFKASAYVHVTVSASAHWRGPFSPWPFTPTEGEPEAIFTIELPDYAPDENDVVVFLSPGKGEGIMLELNGQILVAEKHF